MSSLKMPPILRFVICEICGKRTSNSAKKHKFMANFPLDALRCKQWIKVVGKEDLLHLPIEKLHSFKYVCGNHFIGKDFSKKRNCLNKSAVPSINLNADPLPDEMLLDFPSNISRELCNDQVSKPQVKAITEPYISDEENFKLKIKREADVTIIHTSDKDQLFDTKSSSCDETDNFIPCRICAQEEGKIPIFNNERNPHIPEDIKNFSAVVITRNDGMSQFMCNDCLELLNECITFRDMCRLTNKSILDASSENNKNCSEDGDDDVQDDNQNLEAVSENHLKEPEIWKCPLCNKVFVNLESYETHLKSCLKPTERKNSETTEDPVQGKRKRDYSNYREGKIKLSKPTSDTPGLSQPEIVNLTESDKDKALGLYGGNMLKCPHCDHKAPTAVDLLGHVRQVHDSRTPNKCNYCSTNTKNNEEGISQHVTKYQCDVCFKYLQTVHSLRRHKKTVHENKRQNCKVRFKQMIIETTIDELECEFE